VCIDLVEGIECADSLDFTGYRSIDDCRKSINEFQEAPRRLLSAFPVARLRKERVGKSRSRTATVELNRGV
jgi:hypothetical protein